MRIHVESGVGGTGSVLVSESLLLDVFFPSFTTSQNDIIFTSGLYPHNSVLLIGFSK